jgi:hypothetical protein
MPLVKSPNPNVIIREIKEYALDGIKPILDTVVEHHVTIVEPWEEAKDKPQFIPSIERIGSQIWGRVEMIGERAEKTRTDISVWQLLERGTKIRWMQLSEDWESKTTPRSLTSGPGAGTKLDLDFNAPMPGIEARDWADTVGVEVESDANDTVERTYAEGFEKAFS